MGNDNSPMLPQKRLHSTITALVLDQPTKSDYQKTVFRLKKHADKFHAIAHSQELKELKLVLDTWKILPDGNLGLQFNCDPSQNTTISLTDLHDMLEQQGAHLKPNQKKSILDTIMNNSTIYKPDNPTLTFTRLQWIRLKLALAGAEIKAYHPGTLMVVAWTRDAEALKNHSNLPHFIDTVHDLVQSYRGLAHDMDRTKEFAYKSRTQHPDYTTDLEKTGRYAKFLGKDHLLIQP